jgi:hypothetical protein
MMETTTPDTPNGQGPSDTPGTMVAEGQAVLFGYPPSEVRATLRPRPRSWRLTGAAQRVAVSLAVAPFVAMVPPHAPWLIGVLTAGGVMARRRWLEEHTLTAIEGACPSCGTPLEVKSGRLRFPHPLTCEACHHVSSLRLAEGALGANGAETAKS